MDTDEGEIDEDEGNEAKPVDESVGPHVGIIFIEVGKDALLHVQGLSQMSDDEGGGVVGEEADQ